MSFTTDATTTVPILFAQRTTCRNERVRPVVCATRLSSPRNPSTRPAYPSQPKRRRQTSTASPATARGSHILPHSLQPRPNRGTTIGHCPVMHRTTTPWLLWESRRVPLMLGLGIVRCPANQPNRIGSITVYRRHRRTTACSFSNPTRRDPVPPRGLRSACHGTLPHGTCPRRRPHTVSRNQCVARDTTTGGPVTCSPPACGNAAFCGHSFAIPLLGSSPNFFISKCHGKRPSRPTKTLKIMFVTDQST